MTLSLPRFGAFAGSVVIAAALMATPAVAAPQQQTTITLRDAQSLLIVEGPADGTPMFERAIAPAPCPTGYNTSARLVFTPEGGEPIAISADTKLADPAQPAELAPEIPFIDVAMGAPAGELGVQCLANEPGDFPNPAPEMMTLHVTFPTETTYRVDPLPVPDTSNVTLEVTPLEATTAPATITTTVSIDPAASGTVTLVDAATGATLGTAAVANGTASTQLTINASTTIKAVFTPSDEHIVLAGESAPVAVTIAGTPAPSPLDVTPSSSATPGATPGASDTPAATNTTAPNDGTTNGDLSSTGAQLLPAGLTLTIAALAIGTGYIVRKRQQLKQ